MILVKIKDWIKRIVLSNEKDISALCMGGTNNGKYLQCKKKVLAAEDSKKTKGTIPKFKSILNSL